MSTENKTPRLSKGEYIKAKKAEQRAFLEEHVVEHRRNLVYLLKNNTEIRRFTSKRIIAYLKDTGDIQNETKCLVKFGWGKFTVIIDGLGSDYRYTEEFFIDALVSSFGDFAASATNTIKIFLDKEGIEYAPKGE